jgi:hypothetical protein
MRVQVDGTTISRWWLLLNSDPEPAEVVSIGCKLAVGMSILVRTAAPPDKQPAPLPGGLIATLGDHAALVGAFLVVLAVIHMGGVLHSHLSARRVCALLSSFWWLFSAYLVVDLIGWLDARLGMFAVLWLISTWTSWRLWRPGVRDSRDG